MSSPNSIFRASPATACILRRAGKPRFQRYTFPALLQTRRNASSSAMNFHTVPKLFDPSLLKLDVAYVNGEWVKAKSGKTFEVHDPTTGKTIGTVPEMDASDAETAIAAAATAFKTFKTWTGRERSKVLRKWYDLMIENQEDIATLITWENGKPIGDARGGGGVCGELL